MIARHRARASVTQETVAELAALELGYISLIERGLRIPTVDTIFRRCKGLEVSPPEIIRSIGTQEAAETKAFRNH